MRFPSWFVASAATVCLVFVCALPVWARERGAVEVGLDGGMAASFVRSKTVTGFSFPAQTLRVGVFMHPYVQFEPTLSVSYESVNLSYTRFGTSVETESAVYGIAIALPFLVHVSQDWETAVPYFRFRPTLIGVGDEDSSQWQFGIGGGGGVKIPASTNWAARVQLDVTYFLEREGRLASHTDLELMVGVSYFTK